MSVAKFFLVLGFITYFLWRCDAQTPVHIGMADPTIFAYQGTYYLYGTLENNDDEGFKVYSSKDKINWTPGGVVLKKTETFGNKGFWAPQVFSYREKIYLAYVANEHIAIAESDSPLGPFKQKISAPLAAPVKMIDPFIFFDGGKIYLYHVRLDQGNRIFVAEMTEDFSSIKAETLKECVHATEPWENTENSEWSVTEGPTVIKRGETYYLFYSANDFRNKDYAVGYATSKSPMGPWNKRALGPIVSRQQTGVNGSGHGDLILTSGDTLDYVFHTHESNQNVGKRKTAMISIIFPKNAEKGTLAADPETFRYLFKH